MIIQKFVEIKVSARNMNWYIDKGFDNIRCGDIITVDIKDINIGSTKIISVACDSCQIKKEVTYNYYYGVTKKLTREYLCKKCGIIRIKETNMARYGAEFGLQTNRVKELSKHTMIKKYGVDNISKLDRIKEDRSLEMQSRTNDYNERILKKYGCNVSKLPFIKNKKKETMLRNWGVENPSQQREIFEKAQKNGKRSLLHTETELMYRGSYELDFLEFCKINNIKVTNGPTFTYSSENKNKYYHSDFFLPENKLIIEIKSSYYFEKYYETNVKKKEAAINAGFNFIFIIDKNYDQLKSLLNGT